MIWGQDVLQLLCVPITAFLSVISLVERACLMFCSAPRTWQFFCCCLSFFSLSWSLLSMLGKLGLDKSMMRLREIGWWQIDNETYFIFLPILQKANMKLTLLSCFLCLLITDVCGCVWEYVLNICIQVCMYKWRSRALCKTLLACTSGDVGIIDVYNSDTLIQDFTLDPVGLNSDFHICAVSTLSVDPFHQP